MGYESSYGMALHAVELLEAAITSQSKLWIQSFSKLADT
jgi:hypothetical protein